ncbi:MAG: methylase [Verrucomicrobiales bacterium]|nr:methylase [Verrucomicrobiales bacterium]
MLNKETKRRIDNARDILVGQLPLPSDQIELITIALIYKFMDDIDEQSRELGGKSTFFVGDLRGLSWRKLISNTLSGDERVTKFIQGIEAVSDAKNQSIPELFKSIFKNAFLKFRDGQVLKLFLDEINGFNYDHSEELGNAFEYLLDTMGTQGQNGQFRTPRNIIEFIVDVVDPQKDEAVLDPACGTAGFLISAFKHILAANTSAKAAEKDPHAGDQLKSAAREKLTRNITGYDITPLMCRLSRVNMYLHHFANPVIHEYDTLTNKNRWGDKFDVILANPPFMTPTGGISTHDKFRIAAKRAEVLFADFILEHLNANGRAGFIVPEGIIFQNNDDYVSLRKWLINEAGLWAVVSLPANIFQPYSGVKTTVMLVDRALARQRNEILLVKVENDGFSLNTNRTPVPQNDLPAALELLKVAKQPDFRSAIPNLKSAIQHRIVPRGDFAKLDAYKAGSNAWDFVRKFHVRAERLKKAATDARAAGNHDEAEKVQKALTKLPAEFSEATGLPKLPDTEAKLRAIFDEAMRAEAVNYGDKPNQPGKLTSDLREALDNKRDYPLTSERTGDQKLSQNAKWPSVALGEICTFMTGGTPISTRVDYYENGTVPWLVSGDIHGFEIWDCKKRITPKAVSNSSARVLPKNSVLIALNGQGKTRGTVALLRMEGATCNQSLVGITPIQATRAMPEFIFWMLRSIYSEIRDMTGDNERSGLNIPILKSIRIPLPPLEVQKEVVAEIEIYQRVVEGCADVLDHYRPSLTLSPDWPTIELGEICTIKSGGTPDRGNPSYWGGEIPWVTTTLIDNGVIHRVNEFITREGLKNCPAWIVPKGTVLMAMYGQGVTRGRVAILGMDAAVNQACAALLIRSPLILNGYLFAILQTCYEDLRRISDARGGNQSNLSAQLLKEYVIPLPPIKTQKIIVAEHEREQATLAGAEELRSKYAAKIATRLAAVWGVKP